MIELINSYIQIVTNGAFDEIAFPLICKNSIGEVCTIEDSEGHKILAANDLDVLESRALAVLITTLLNQHHKELSTLTILKSDEQSVIGDKNSDTTTTETTITSNADNIIFPLRYINGLHTSTIKDSNNRVLNPPQVVVDHFEYPKVATITNGFTWELGVCSEFEIDQVKLG